MSQPQQQQVQRVGVPIAASIDSDTVEFINDITPFVPWDVREEFWGYANNQIGLAKFTPNQAKATILGAKNMISLAIMAMPRWKVDAVLLIRAENFMMLVKEQVWRATTISPDSERQLMSKQTTFSEQRTFDGSAQRSRGVFDFLRRR